MIIYQLQKIEWPSDHAQPLFRDMSGMIFSSKEAAAKGLEDYLKSNGYTGSCYLTVPILDEDNYRIGEELKEFPKAESFKIVSYSVLDLQKEENTLPF